MSQEAAPAGLNPAYPSCPCPQPEDQNSIQPIASLKINSSSLGLIQSWPMSPSNPPHVLGIARAGAAHLYFECIHPLGNGRGGQRSDAGWRQPAAAVGDAGPAASGLPHATPSSSRRHPSAAAGSRWGRSWGWTERGSRPSTARRAGRSRPARSRRGSRGSGSVAGGGAGAFGDDQAGVSDALAALAGDAQLGADLRQGAPPLAATLADLIVGDLPADADVHGGPPLSGNPKSK